MKKSKDNSILYRFPLVLVFLSPPSTHYSAALSGAFDSAAGKWAGVASTATGSAPAGSVAGAATASFLPVALMPICSAMFDIACAAITCSYMGRI